MTNNRVDTVFAINGSTEGHILAGMGQKTVGNILSHYPLVRRGVVNIVVLKGFMINNNFVPFRPEEYAVRYRKS